MTEFPIAWRLQVQGAQDVKRRLEEINREFENGTITTEQYTQKLRMVNRDAVALNSSVRIQTNLWRAQHPVLATVERSLGRVAGIARSVQSAVNTFSLLRIAASGSSEQLVSATDELSRAQRDLAEANKRLAENPTDPKLMERVADAQDKVAEATNRLNEAQKNIDQQKLDTFVGTISSIAAIGGDIGFAAFGIKQLGLNKEKLGKILDKFPIARLSSVVGSFSTLSGLTSLGVAVGYVAAFAAALAAIDQLTPGRTRDVIQESIDNLKELAETGFVQQPPEPGQIPKFPSAGGPVVTDINQIPLTPEEASFGRDRTSQILAEQTPQKNPRNLLEEFFTMLGLPFLGSMTRGMTRNPEVGDRSERQIRIIELLNDRTKKQSESTGSLTEKNVLLSDSVDLNIDGLTQLSDEYLEGSLSLKELQTGVKDLGITMAQFVKFVQSISVTRKGRVISEFPSVGEVPSAGASSPSTPTTTAKTGVVNVIGLDFVRKLLTLERGGITKSLTKEQFDQFGIHALFQNPDAAFRQARLGQIANTLGFARGGMITEPIIGVGKSGQTYSFGEGGKEMVIPSGKGMGITIIMHNTFNGLDRKHARQVAEMVSDEITAKLGPIGI